MKQRISTRKITLGLLLFLRIALPSLAQNIQGKVQDSLFNALPFANVLLLHAQDSSLIKGAVTDTEGFFHLTDIDSGHYLIHTLMIGYQATYATMDIGSAPAPFLTVTLQEETMELDEVTITAQKPLYEKLLDRTVVNVQSSVTSTGKSALEVLAKSPGVQVNRQNNTLSMYGKSGVMVMINGKMSRLPIDAVVQMLNGMNAANIDKIELITTPPAKYDAEGNAGLINIVMVENIEAGTNGTIGLTAGHNQGPTGGGNLNLNHRENRFSLFLDYSVLSDRNEDPWIDERIIFGETFNQIAIGDQQRANFTTIHNLRMGVEYELSKKTTTQLLLTGYRRNWDLDGLTDHVNLVSPDSAIFTTMKLHESNIWQSASGSFGITHQINEQQSLQVAADYLYYVNDNPSTYRNTAVVNQKPAVEEVLDVTKDTPIYFKVGKIDYANQLSNQLKVEAGLKGSLSNFTNDVVVRTLKEGQLETDDRFTNFAQLDEKIWAGYISFDWAPTNELKIYGGLRYEFTDTYLSTDEQPGVVDREYGNLFPSINISQQFNEANQFILSYARRGIRPVFNDMAPFVFFTGPNFFYGGNPALRPAISDGIDLSYHHNSWWLSLKFNNTRNSIALMQPEINEETGEQIFRAHNMKYLKIWTLSSSVPFSITPWWEMQLDLSIHRQAYETSYLKENFADQSINVTVSGTSTFMLPYDFTIELSGNYQSKQLWGIWEFAPYGQLDAGIKKPLPKNQGSLTLTFTDIFHTSLWNAEQMFPDGRTFVHTDYDPNVQSINLTYTRSFGNRTLKSVQLKAGAVEERKRVN